MKIKKIISAIAAAAIVCGAVPSQPFNTVTKNTVITADAADSANSGKCGENLTWAVDDNGTLTISGTGDMYRPHLMPSSFYNIKSKVTSIVIEEGLTSIDPYVFGNMPLLENVTIPNTVTFIGEEAFCDCTKLKKINIPESVETIDIGAFENCTNLEVINIPSTVKNIGGVAFLNTKWLDNQRAKNPLVVVNGTLVDAQTCKGDIVIPDTVKVISENAFFECEELTSVVLPDSVVSIRKQAFMLCSSLTSVTIPKSVTVIEVNDFQDSPFAGSSDSLVINGYIPSTAYYHALDKGIDFYDIENKILHKCDYLFEAETGTFKGYAKPNDASLLIIPSEINGVKVSIIAGIGGPEVNSQNKKVENVIIPDTVTTITELAFWGCSALKSVTIPDSVNVIKTHAFFDCCNLTSIVIPKSVTSLSNYSIGYRQGVTSYEKKIEGFTIYGYKGSAAERYANANDFTFIEIGSQAITTGTTTSATTTTSTTTTTTTKKATTTTTTKATTTTTTTTTTSTTTLNSSVLTAKPIISADKITIKESEIPSDRIVNVNINVSGAENCYCATGIKVYYENLDVDHLNINFGSAAEKLHGMYDALSYGLVFFATSGQGDYGKDGVYATIPFILPETAKAGDKFKIFFKYDDTQLFLDYNKTGQEMREYALKNAVDGYIEIVGDGSETVGKAGDANADGEVSLADAVLILQSISSPDKFGENGSDKNHITAQGAKNADVYERGSGLTPQDALQIQKYLSKLITTLD